MMPPFNLKRAVGQGEVCVCGGAGQGSFLHILVPATLVYPCTTQNSPLFQMDLSATEAIAKDLQKRKSEETTFVIVLTSQKLLEHLEQRLEGMPVQFIQHLRTQ